MNLNFKMKSIFRKKVSEKGEERIVRTMRKKQKQKQKQRKRKEKVKEKKKKGEGGIHFGS